MHSRAKSTTIAIVIAGLVTAIAAKPLAAAPIGPLDRVPADAAIVRAS